MLMAVVFLAVLPTASASGAVLVPGDWIRDGDGGWISPNLVRNPSVEEGRQGKPTAWSLESPGGGGAWDADEGHSGKRSLRLEGPGSWKSQPFPLQAGLITTVSVLCRLEGAARWGSMARLDFLNVGGKRLAKVDLYLRDPHGWRPMRTALEAPAGTVSGVLVGALLDQDLRAWYDDFEVRQWRPVRPEPAVLEPPGPMVRAFDFGTQDSPLQPGFLRVAPGVRYLAEAGFGWLSSVRLRGLNQDAAQYRPTQVDFRGEPVQRQRTQLDPLTRDTVAGQGAARFQVDLPRDTYRVFVLAGHSRSDVQPPYFDLVVTAGGRLLGRLSKRFQAVGYVWDEFTVDVEDGGLGLGLLSDHFNGAWSVAALVVYPESAAVAGERLVAGILSSVNRLPQDLLRQWRRVPFLPAALLHLPREEDSPPGTATLAVFPLVTDVLPTTPLEYGERVTRLKAAAAPGLTADITFSLRPRVDLQRFTMELDPLVGPHGVRLPADAAQLFVVVSRSVRYNRAYINPSYYRYQPDALDPQLPGTLEAGKTTRFWLRVYLPADAEPGLYRSVLRRRAGDEVVEETPVEVQVLPFHAVETDLFQNVYFYGRASRFKSLPGSPLHAAGEEVRSAAIRDIVAHVGSAAAYLRSWPVYRDAEGRWTVELAFTREVLEDFRRAGHPAEDAIISLLPLLRSLAKQILPKAEAQKIQKHLRSAPEFTDEYWRVLGELLRQVDDMLEEEGVTQRLYNPMDEARGHDLPFYVEIARVLHRQLNQPSVFCNVSPWIYFGKANHEEQPALQPWCNVWWVYGTLTDEERLRERQGGTRLMGRFEVGSPAAARAAAGLLRWRRQEEGGHWWSYDAVQGSMNTQLDGPSYGDRVLAYPTHPPSPRLVWEAARLGHEDLRYLHTLEALSQGKASCKEQRRPMVRGRRLLQDLHARLDPSLSEPFSEAAEYDRVREQWIQAIEEIHAARGSCAIP